MPWLNIFNAAKAWAFGEPAQSLERRGFARPG
jgi:hypothetical protein